MKLLPLLIAVASLAAEERAQVSGSVRDASDAVLQNTDVTAVNEDTGIRRSTKSDAKGDYGIASLPAGIYKITVRKPGFQTIAQLNVRLNPAQSARLDFTMQVGSMREVVTIESAPTLMNSQDASVGTTAGSHLLDALPLNGREILTIISLSPGVVTTPATQGEAGQFSANGQRPNANYFTVDGVSANTGVSGSVTPAQFSGGTLPTMTAFGGTQTLSAREDIEEVRVQTSSFAPEFGRTPGANVGITTRSGTNDLHGSAFFIGRNDVLNANDWFANSLGLARVDGSLADWGATLGGALKRDRTFFFANYEGLRLTEPFTWLSAVPSEEIRATAPVQLRPLLAAFPMPNGPSLGPSLGKFGANVSQPSNLEVGTLRIDHALTSRISILGKYQKAPSSTDAGFAQVDHSTFNNDSFTFGATAQASPNITSDLRVNVTRTSVASHWVATGAGGSIPVNLASIFQQSAAEGNVLYGFAIGGVGQILAGDGSSSRQRQLNVVETLSWNHFHHAVRWGIDYDRLSPARNAIATNIAGAYATIDTLLANGPMMFSLAQADEASSLVESLSLFAQDTWRVNSRLSATYGIRWELTPAPSYRFGAAPSATAPSPTPAGTPIWPMRLTQLAPRLGIAYRLAPATVLRAGWGIFYDVEFGVATDPINAFPYNRWQFTGVSGTTPSTPISYSGYAFAPNLKLPYAREWNIALDHALGNAQTVSASYVGSGSRRLLRREAALGADGQPAGSPLATNNGNSDFNALELQYRRRLSAGVQALASYTWSHSIDNGSWDSGIYLPANVSRDRGSSTFDVRHNFSAGITWQVHRWLLSSVISARSGFPIDVLSTENLLGLGFDDYPRPNLVASVPVWISDSSVPGGRRLNPSAFAPPRTGRQGNLGRDSIAGFGLAQVDLALGREFPIRDEGVVALRIEAFNVGNHAQFGDPIGFLDNPLFGSPISMLNLMLGSGTPHSGVAPAFQVGGSRTIQATVRFRF